MSHDLQPAKAKEILKDGTVHGKKITAKQRRYMGWVAGGGLKKGKKKTPLKMSDF